MGGRKSEGAPDGDPGRRGQVIESIIERAGSSPYYRTLGIELEGLGRGRASARMPAGSRLFNVGGIVHGGAITSIAEAASGAAVATELEPGERADAVELEINFCAPVTAGTLEARGRVVKRGGRVFVCEVDVTEAERLVAKGLSTYLVPRPVH